MGDAVDNLILQLGDLLTRKHKAKATVISLDGGVIGAGASHEIPVETWEGLYGGQAQNTAEFYKGWQAKEYDRKEYESVCAILRSKGDPKELGIDQLHPNEFFIAYLKGDNGEYYTAYFDASKDQLIPFRITPKTAALPKNALQACYMYACRTRSIPIVWAIGAAGTSKTFTAVDAIFEQLLAYYAYDSNRDVNSGRKGERQSDNSGRKGEGQSDKRFYDKAIICRPMIGVSDGRGGGSIERELGAIPGTIHAKTMPWLAPIYDNLDLVYKMNGVHPKVQQRIMKADVLEVLIAQMVRGRSLNNTYLLVDEAQNLTLPMYQTMGERMGERSKIVIVGDPYQSDILGNYGDGCSLIHGSNIFRDDSRSATIFFPEAFNVRGEISRAFTERLRQQ